MRRMDAINAFRKTNLHTSPEQREAYLRMALFPSEAEVIFVRPEIWVVSWDILVLQAFDGSTRLNAYLQNTPSPSYAWQAAFTSSLAYPHSSKRCWMR